MQAYAGARDEYVLPGSLSIAVEARARALGVTPFVLYFAAYQLLLWRHGGRNDFAVGLPVAGRESVESQALVGLFVNTLAHRVQIDGRQSLQAFVQALNSKLSEDLAHQSLPFEQLLDVLDVERSLDRTPLFQTMFNYQVDHQDSRSLDLPGISAQALALPGGVVSAKFDLTFNLFTQGRGAEASTGLIVEYATALLRPDITRRLVEDYQALLASLASLDLDARLLEIPLCSVAALATEGQSLPLHGEADWVTRFEVQAAVHPERIAVYCADRQLSYAALEAQANRLAHWLLAQSVGRESLVAFCLPRDERLLVCMLGIQKAGAAYLPLDRAHPRPARRRCSTGRSRICCFAIRRRPIGLPSCAFARGRTCRWRNSPRRRRDCRRTSGNWPTPSTPRDPPDSPRACRSVVATSPTSCWPWSRPCRWTMCSVTWP